MANERQPSENRPGVDDESAAADDTLRHGGSPKDSPNDSSVGDGEFIDLSHLVGSLALSWPQPIARGEAERAGQAASGAGFDWAEQPRVGRFVILHEVGRGGFGIVFKAHDPRLGRTVALKVARADSLASDDAPARIQREATIAARLDHPGIVPVYEAGADGALSYIVSQFCDGPDLRRWLRDNPGRLSPQQSAALAVQLADALDYAHRCGVTHRDVKPANVLLVPLAGSDEQDAAAGLALRPRLTDFGLASMQSAQWSNTRTSLVIGTPLYMAPECFAGRGSQARSAADIYSLGAVLYELLTGRPPIEGEAFGQMLQRIAHQHPTPPHEIDDRVPVDLSVICSKCLAKDAEDRYAATGDLADDLRRFLQGEPIRARPATWRDHFAKWCQRPQRIVFAGRYSYAFHLLIIGWVLVNVVSVGLFRLAPPEQVQRSAVDFVLATATIHLPKAWLGWRVACDSRWAFWPSALLGFVCTAIFAVAAFGHLPFFEYNYPNPVSRVAICSMLMFASLVDLGAYVLAVPAFLRGGGQRPLAGQR